MLMQLSDRETSILLGATLMHWGVPFHRTKKHELTSEQQAIADVLSEKLISARQDAGSPILRQIQSVQLSDNDAALLVQILDDCLKEIGNDSTELSLQLKTTDRREIEALINRMRPSVAA
jgi:hypothetical protein